MSDDPPITGRQASSRWRVRVWLRIAAPAVLVVSGALATVIVGVHRYIRSDGFRHFLGRQASVALNADAVFSPLVWHDNSAWAAEFIAQGGATAPFTRLDAHDLRTSVDLSGLWERTWHLPQIEIEDVSIELGERPLVAPTVSVAEAAREPHARSWFSGWIPRAVRVDEIAVRQASLRYGRGGQNFFARDVAMTMRPEGREAFIVHGRGGQIHLADGRRFALENLVARLSGGIVYLTEARGRSVDGGMLVTVSGEVGDRLDLRAQFTNLGADEWLAENWKRRLRGRVDGEAVIEGPAGHSADIVTDGRFALKDGQIEFLPLLDKIAGHTKNESFRRLVISSASARFRRHGGRLEVRDFKMESPGLLRIEGRCDVVNDVMDGVFQVGIAPGTLRWVPGAESRVFSRPEDGFLWTGMRLAGPAAAPREDLSGRLADAALAQTIEDVPKNAIKAAGEAVETATELGGKLLNKSSSLLEHGSDFLKGFAPLLK